MGISRDILRVCTPRRSKLRRLTLLILVWLILTFVVICSYFNSRSIEGAYKAMFEETSRMEREANALDYHQNMDYVEVVRSANSMKLMANKSDKSKMANLTQSKKSYNKQFNEESQRSLEWQFDRQQVPETEKAEAYHNKIFNDTTEELLKLFMRSDSSNETRLTVLNKLSNIMGEDLLSEFVSKLQKAMLKEDNDNAFQPQQYPLRLDLPNYYKAYLRSGKIDLSPINNNMNVIFNPIHKCKTKNIPEVVFIVKTSPSNYKRRSVIRSTWGNEANFPSIRVVFSLGIPENSEYVRRIHKEWTWYKDILFVGYLDTYYNLTLKTISGLNWAHDNCSNSKYIISVDDDVYVATDILLQKLRNLDPETAVSLYTGHVYYNTGPLRDTDGYYSKWYVDENEFPWDTYPTYVFGGFVVMSMKTVFEFHFASKYTTVFKFEDVYLGILASRMGIEVSEVFDPYVDNFATYSSTESFKTVIASHGYGLVKNLRQAWECHLALVQNNLEKLVYCHFIDKYILNIRQNIDDLLTWVDTARATI